METMHCLAQKAKKTSLALQGVSSATKNAALIAMAKTLREQQQAILTANEKDIEAGIKRQLNKALLGRLKLNPDRIEAMAKGLEQVAKLPDPVGEIIETIERPNGLVIRKVRVPIGVIAIIYESRPNVTADVAGLCLKTANVAILRGGREAIHSNCAIANCLVHAIENNGLPKDVIQLVKSTDREDVKILVQLSDYIDLVIPRGGEGLIKTVTELSRVPVIKHYKGVCHTYVDENADINMAVRIVENAKCQRPGVCNALETLLVHEKIAADFLPKIADVLATHKVELRGDEKTQQFLPKIKSAEESDWTTEYLDLILAIKIVADVQKAVEHINDYGSHHSDAIITNNKAVQDFFTQNIDSATVYVNASTRFTDGAEFGMGAEIGISTDKLHARGPMGLRELTTYKYVIMGSGQIR